MERRGERAEKPIRHVVSVAAAAAIVSSSAAAEARTHVPIVCLPPRAPGLAGPSY